MFLADHRFRFEIPAGLATEPIDVSYFSVIEQTLHSPLWVLQVMSRVPDEDGLRRVRRLFFAELEAALSPMQEDNWAWVELYVLRPLTRPGLPQLALERCHSVWRCDEPEDQGPCWRVETESGVLLHSLLGTELGEEHNATVAWSDPRRD